MAAQSRGDLASRHGSIGRIAVAHSWSYRSDNPICTRTGEKEGKAATIRFVQWLRSYGWTVSTEHSGPMRIGGWTEEDEDVAKLVFDLLDEFTHAGLIY